MQVKKQQLELDMEQTGPRYGKVVYCHPAYLTYMQSIPCEMLGWMKNKLESRLPGEILIMWPVLESSLPFPISLCLSTSCNGEPPVL